MLSMTGYGSGESSAAGVTITAELRAVNHRFLDVAIKAPVQLAGLENDIRAFLKERLARGRISCSIQLSLEAAITPVRLEGNRLRQGLDLLTKMADHMETRTGKRPEITLDHLLAVPELLQTGEDPLEVDAVRPVMLDALTQALDQLVEMKTREGRELAVDLEHRLAALRGHRDEVARLAPTAAQDAYRKLRDRLEQFTLEQVDPQRLAQETALLADRSNINEECERLASHLEQFRQTLTSEGQIAKRLNFLLQEMHREVNTMGSKTNLIAVTQVVIAMKEEIESMREQIQNLE